MGRHPEERELDSLSNWINFPGADHLVQANGSRPLCNGMCFGESTVLRDTPEEAADMICEALRAKPKHMGTALGTFGEVLYALSPKTVDRILHLAYRVFPDSAAAKGSAAKGKPVSKPKRPRKALVPA